LKKANKDLDEEGIHNVYPKKNKKSISLSARIDLFIVICIAVFIITAIIIGLSSKSKIAEKMTEIFLSPRCEEIFGESITASLLNEYAKRNPGLRIQLSLGSVSSQSDIMVFDEGDYYKLINENALTSLRPYQHSENSRQFAIPLVTFIDLLFYNADILREAGFDRPPKTRDEFLAYAKTVSKSNAAISGAALALGADDYQAVRRDIFSWIWAAGGNFWRTDNEPNEKPQINAKSIIGDISFLGKLYVENAIAPDSFTATGRQRLEEFADGKIAMITASSAVIPYLRSKMTDNAFGLTTIPGTTGKYSAGLSGVYAGISADCQYPDEAWNFLLLLAEKSPMLCAQLEAVPGALSDFSAGKYIKDNPLYAKAWNIFESAEIANGFSGMKYGLEYETIVREELQNYFISGRSAEATAAEIQKRWDAIPTEEQE